MSYSNSQLDHYNLILYLISKRDFVEAEKIAKQLKLLCNLNWLCVGWHKLPLVGHEDLDRAIKDLDKHFTGPREVARFK